VHNSWGMVNKSKKGKVAGKGVSVDTLKTRFKLNKLKFFIPIPLKCSTLQSHLIREDYTTLPNANPPPQHPLHPTPSIRTHHCCCSITHIPVSPLKSHAVSRGLSLRARRPAVKFVAWSVETRPRQIGHVGIHRIAWIHFD
jgi:hypothetical protein